MNYYKRSNSVNLHRDFLGVQFVLVQKV